MLRGSPLATLNAPPTGVGDRQRQHVRACNVTHVHEVAQLAAVLEHPRRLDPRSSALRKIEATPA